MTEHAGMSEEQQEFWAERRFDREVATARKRLFLDHIGHEKVQIVTGEEWRQQELDLGEDAPEIEETPWEVWPEGQKMPSSAASFVKKLLSEAFELRVYRRHGAHISTRKLKHPEGDFCLIAAVRGEVKFTAMWKEAGGKWTAADCLDYTPSDGIVPRLKTITELKKDRL